MSLPTFFGRATAASAQHVHLATLLQELTATCVGLERGEPCSESEPLRLLDELEREMRGHFLAEESDGYFGTLVAELPTLLPRVAELRADHTRMMEIIGELRRLASAPDQRARLASETLALDERFKAHERVEADLVREFLLQDRELGGV